MEEMGEEERQKIMVKNIKVDPTKKILYYFSLKRAFVFFWPRQPLREQNNTF